MADNNKLPEELQPLIDAGIKVDNSNYETDEKGCVIKLTLNNKSITDVSWIEGMAELRELSLSSNQIRNAAPLYGLANLVRLYVYSNQISNAEPLRNLTNLTELSLSSNQISNAEPLRNLTNLTYLDLSSNQISNAESLLGLTNLTYLDLSSNQINNAESLQGLTNLIELDLSSNQISNADPLRNLTNLAYLDLSSNQISNLEPLCGLTNLTYLDLSSNQINNATPLRDLMNLTELSLSSNQINNIEALRSLTNLTALSLSSNQINNIEAVRSLTNLTELYISSNQISNTEPLRGLMNLTSLYLSSNRISYTGPFHSLTKVEKFGIDDNPITGKIPPETIAAGWQAILQYLNTTADERVEIREAKVLLLGNPNVGKSDLLHYLETGMILPEGERGPTHGLIYKKLRRSSGNYGIHCWDFGGQEFYHATHQLFFSPGALHLLLWANEDVRRKGMDQEVFFETGYWLRCIEQLSKDGNNKAIETILIENKIDLQGNASMLLRQSGIQEKITRFTNLNIHIVSVSIQKELRLGGLKELITERIYTLFSKHPAIYNEYRERIHALGKAMLTFSDIDPKAKGEDLTIAMKVLHNIGCLLYFPDMIPGKVFAKPGVLLALLYDHVLQHKSKYTITTEELENAIKGNELGLSIKEVKALLLGFHLVFCVPSKKETYYIPQYLPTAPPWMDFFERHYFKKVYNRITSDSFLMHHALLRLFSRYAEYIKTRDGQELMFWKDGLVIERDNQILLIRFNRKEQCIDLYNDIEDKNFDLRREVMEYVVSLPEEQNDKTKMQTAEREHETLPKDQEAERQRKAVWESPDFDVLVSTDGIYFASLKKIVENANRNIYYVEAKDSEGNVKACSVFDFNKYLPNNMRGAMKKIFISYSKADLELVTKFEDHLSAMKLDGKVASWYCTELRAGSNWDDEIQQHFKEADIICFMVSPNFMKTKYIHEYEIKWAVDRKRDKKDLLIIPIILNFCSWQTAGEYSLGKYTALPYTAKPVMDFDNRDMAWYLITECIRLAINNGADLKEEDYYSQQLPMEVRKLFVRIIEGDTGQSTKP